MTSLPLAGIRILSLAEQYPGPFATMLLADLGADVILIERPDGGDPSRRFPGLFASLNRNKRSVTLNLKSSVDYERFLQLVDSSDVVIEGFRPGVMERLNLSANILRARKPSLIFTSISSFGQNGPMASVAGHDLSIQAAAGIIDVPLGKEVEAILPTLPLADIASAMFAAMGIVTALFSRSHSGEGTQLDVSMFDSLISWMTPFLVPSMNNLPVRPLPPLDPGYGIFATSDGQQLTLSIAGEDHMWHALCEVLELPQFSEWREEERNKKALEISPLLRAAIARHPLHWLCKRLEEKHIAFSPVCHPNKVVTDPQIVARGMVVQVDTDKKKWQFIRQPLIFDGKTTGIARLVPTLGQHTDEVLGEDVASLPRS